MKSVRMILVVLSCIGVWACNAVLGTGEFHTSDCIDDTKRCNGNQPEICKTGQWQPSSACVHQACRGEGVCTGQCTPDDTQCDGVKLQRCGKSGEWNPSTECAFGICISGVCTVQCDEGKWRCLQQQPQQCISKRWQNNGSPCNNQTCYSDGEVVECKGMCAPGKRCFGSTPQHCDESGQWADDEHSCKADEYCQGGECVLECVPGDLRCWNNTRQTCAQTKRWDDIEPPCNHSTCNTTTIQCEGVCAPGEKQCRDNTVQNCNSGSWNDGSKCDTPCVDGKCTISCTDGSQNGDETDVDCGGGTCSGCDDGRRCKLVSDCLNNVCVNGTCGSPGCIDTIQNGAETDVDCGGTTCGPCPATKKCNIPADCSSRVCLDGICQEPTCSDNVQNGQESDRDCGEACDMQLCGVLQSCNSPLDCQSFSCKDNLCQAPTCTDDTKNGTETDIDCGGGQCPGCEVGQGCNSGSDCKEEVCGTNLTCSAPTCSDMAANGQETDVDCGGPECVKRCDTDQRCVAPTDCISRVCNIFVCAASNCTDGVNNGTETDVDCGGSCVTKCNPTQTCMVAGDCTSDVCTGGICQAPTCSDGKKNSTETDIDCGGVCVNEGKKCSAGSSCTSPNDCQSGVCPTGTEICSSPKCNDQTKNGTETDIDCGGPACPRCELGNDCISGVDCQTGICLGGRCAPKPNGLRCTFSTECASNFCIDGVCCNEACTDVCKACSTVKKGTGQDGVCGTVVSGQDPDNECAADPESTCGKTGFCNGAGACETYNTATICVQSTCADLVTRQLPQFCNGVGACLTSTQQSCIPYTCQAGACLTGCSIDAQCAGGHYCSINTCVPKKMDGGSCASSNECSNGNCVDFVCCNNACTGLCQACSAGKKGSGVDGVCGPIGNNLDPDNECDATMQSTCGTTGACNGTGQCAQWAPGTACSLAVCTNSTTLSPTATCNGTGTCTVTMQVSCVPYLCNMGMCKSTCAGDTECATGNYCMLSTCVAKKIDGATCVGGNECVSGNCVDGVCCNTTCTGECQSCNVSIVTAGSCTNIPGGQTDANPACNTNGQTCNGSGVCRRLDGAACAGANQCVSGVCTGMICQVPTCNDTVKNGGESDVDCGGSCPTKCRLTQLCNTASDCEFSHCSGGACVASTCTDSAMNGTETDVDCGGSCATKCADGKACVVNSDCANNVCDRGLCVPATCKNGMLDSGNGETATDCGGSNCQICPTLLALTTQGAASPYNVQYGTFNGTTWSGTTLAAGVAIGTPSVAMTKTRYATGIVRKADDTLASTRWIGAVNAWTALTNLPGNPRANGIPDASAFGPYVEVAFRNQGGAGKYYTARYNGSSWDTSFQQTGAPSNATIPDIDFFHRDDFGTAMLSFIDPTPLDPFIQNRTSGSWSTAEAITATTASTLAPNVVKLANGDLLMTFVNTSDNNNVYYSRFSGGQWTTPILARDVAGVDRIRTTIRPDLVVMPNGNVIIVYVNSVNSNKLGAAIYDTTMGAWNTPTVTVSASAATAIVAAPGLPGYDVEVMYNEGTTLRHCRRNSSTLNWEFTTINGLSTTNVQGIGIASFR